MNSQAFFLNWFKICELEAVKSNPLKLEFYLAYFDRQNLIDYIGPWRAIFLSIVRLPVGLWRWSTNMYTCFLQLASSSVNFPKKSNSQRYLSFKKILDVELKRCEWIDIQKVNLVSVYISLFPSSACQIRLHISKALLAKKWTSKCSEIG